jgi:hypothetical protein
MANRDDSENGGNKEMSEIVKCDVCGGLYNQRHLTSHKRLSHGKKNSFAFTVADEPGAVNAIFTLYKRLSAKARKEILDRLTTGVNPN